MSFVKHQNQSIILSEIFNEQHAAMMFEQKVAQHPNFSTLVLHNVGIKIMKDAFEKFAEHPILRVNLDYNWNQIMMMPKLVCYDKNTWKSLQQLANWNKQWNVLFRPCFSLRQLNVRISCSWADDQFIKAFLQGVSALPNVQKVNILVKSKNEKAGEMLQAFRQAKIFPSFEAKFQKIA